MVWGGEEIKKSKLNPSLTVAFFLVYGVSPFEQGFEFPNLKREEVAVVILQQSLLCDSCFSSVNSVNMVSHPKDS